MASILIIEDELVLAHQLATALSSADHQVRTADTAAEGLEAAAKETPDLILLDLRLPDRSGLEAIGDFKKLDENALIVLMTAYGSVRDSVEAMRRGAADYLTKPLDLGELGLLIDRLLRQQRRDRELRYLREQERGAPRIVLGDDPRIGELFAQVDRLCDVGLPPGKRPAILLTGETGSGKGVFARAIHERLGGGPFIRVSCVGISSDAIGAELFGRERRHSSEGSSQPGLFEAAEGGTVVLDEVGDLSIDLQASFLRLLEERRVRRIGSSRDRDVDVHVLATTQRDLDAAVRDGRFRADLLHRLRVLSFEIPPLRHRSGDARILAHHFAAEIGREYCEGPRTISPEAEEVLIRYPWPGNVRELRNVIERLLLVCEAEPLDAETVASLLSPGGGALPGRVTLPEEGVSLEGVERDLLMQALERTRGNRTRAAELVGLSRDTFRYRVAKWGLDRESPP